jgi:hypothetical protein
MLAQIHHRMPTILEPRSYERGSVLSLIRTISLSLIHQNR